MKADEKVQVHVLAELIERLISEWVRRGGEGRGRGRGGGGEGDGMGRGRGGRQLTRKLLLEQNAHTIHWFGGSIHVPMKLFKLS